MNLRELESNALSLLKSGSVEMNKDRLALIDRLESEKRLSFFNFEKWQNILVDNEKIKDIMGKIRARPYSITDLKTASEETLAYGIQLQDIERMKEYKFLYLAINLCIESEIGNIKFFSIGNWLSK